MAAELEPQTYSNVTAFLAAAGIVVPLAKRFKISPVLGFLGAGVALGPYGLGRFVGEVPWLDYVTITKPDQIAGLAEFGVVFLLFMIGLELSWERLKLLRRWVFGLGLLQVACCGLLIGAGAMALGLSFHAAFAVAAALALSSTAVVMPLMEEGGRQHSHAGRAAFAILLFQDLAVAPLLVTLTLLGGAREPSVGRIFLALAPAAIGIAVIVIAGRILLRPLFRSAARAKSQELFMAASLLVVIAASLAAAALGLSPALGAFVAGLLLAETEYRHQVEVMIEPFKGLLLGLFFLSTGVALNLPLLIAQPGLILGAAAGFLMLKVTVTTGLCRAFSLKLGDAFQTGLLIAAGGEFAFVVLNQALESKLVDPVMAQSMAVSAILTMFLLPALSWLGDKASGAMTARKAALDAPPPDAHGGGAPKVLVVGYGRVGELVADMLTRHEIAWVAIDNSPRCVEFARNAGGEAYFGDASKAELLRRCGLADAPAVVVTMDAPEAVEAVVATVRDLRPDIVLVARARDARQASKLYDLGATDAVPETIESSLQLSEAVLVDIGVPMGLVIASIHEKRDEIRKTLNPPGAGRLPLKPAGRGAARGRMNQVPTPEDLPPAGA